CEPRPAGGWRITVGIHPWLHSARYLRHTLVLDSVEETYEFIDGQVRLVKSNAALAKPNRRGFPVAW
ncbi:MAG TPA: hypothetical protein VFU81_11185, partial [Thermomicrobiales bacterium]|nr:hypothetical protein [Thermomicrobiales bacterium]